MSDHEHHERAARWIARAGEIAICPIVEGALIRYAIRVGERRQAAVAVLSAIEASPRCEFWPDQISYAEVGLGHVVGYRQVADAYLASLAATHGGKPTTLDHALAEAHPDRTALIR
jgi:predicted nucleic acid-binding protein